MAHVKARSRGRRYSERRAGSRGAGPRAAGAGNWRLGAGCAMRMQPTDAAQIVATGALRPPRTPSARRRSRRRTTGGAGAGTGRRHRAARSALCHPTRASGSVVRSTCATGVQAARRHPGEVAARRRSRMPAPSARHAPPSARRRARRRTTGGGRPRGPWVIGHPPQASGSIAPRTRATGVQAARRHSPLCREAVCRPCTR